MQEVIKEGDGEGQAWVEEGLIDEARERCSFVV